MISLLAGEEDTIKEPLPLPSMSRIGGEDEETSALHYTYKINGQRITVVLSYDAPAGYDQQDTSVVAEYLDRLEEAEWWLEGEKDPTKAMERSDAVTKEMEEIVGRVCYDKLVELAGSHSEAGDERLDSSASFTQTLHDYMYPQSLVLQLVSHQRELKCIQPPESQLLSQWKTYADISYAKRLEIPMYKSSQIRISKKLMFYRGVLQVSTPEGESYICKLSAGHGESFLREYNILCRMRNAGCNTQSLRVPQLRGIVCTETAEEDGSLVGILTDLVDCERPDLTYHLCPDFLPPVVYQPRESTKERSEEGDSAIEPIRGKDIPDIDAARREKWAAQIQSIVHQLHDLDIVWGDAKTANILLDRNDDLWVVDFGGGLTDGWIPRDLKDTKEGDLRALRRILEEIRGERRVWRADERPPHWGQRHETF